VSNEVVDIFNAASFEKPNIGILDDDFFNDVRNPSATWQWNC
jgi:hypothetical protein